MSRGKSTTTSRRRTVKILGKTIEVEALSLQDWVQAEEQCLNSYRRSRIAAITKNMDLLPEELRDKKIDEAFAAAQDIKVSDLPEMAMDMPMRDAEGKPVKKRGKQRFTPQQVPYTAWWMSKTPEGMRYSVWLAMRRCDESIKLDDVDEFFAEAGEGELDMMADVVGEISEPKMGN